MSEQRSEGHAGEAGESPAVAEVVTKPSSHSVEDTVAAFVGVLEGKGMKVFAVIDHSGEASSVGMDLRDTKLVIFGSPRAGTPLMQAQPLAALDLPLKVLVWADGELTKVSYLDPDALAVRYALGEDLAARIRGINVLTDAVTAR